MLAPWYCRVSCASQQSPQAGLGPAGAVEGTEPMQCIVPARPNRGTSFSSLTTMLRSASFAFFEMLRVCCDPQASRCCRVTLRMHVVHCGSSVGLFNDAIGRDVVGFDGLEKRGRSSGKYGHGCDGERKALLADAPAVGSAYSATRCSPTSQMPTSVHRGLGSCQTMDPGASRPSFFPRYSVAPREQEPAQDPQRIARTLRHLIQSGGSGSDQAPQNA